MEKEKDEAKLWEVLRPKLKKDFRYNKNWREAIELFTKRFKVKYFNPIEKLIEQDWLEGEGFAILTIQCSLIEAFATLKTGQIFMHDRKELSKKKYYYNSSKKIYTDFLKVELIFKDHFWTEDLSQPNGKAKQSPFEPDDFYSDVRCGLVHEARTKGKWIINAEKLSKTNPGQTQFIIKDGDQLKIYRTILHYRLLAYLDSYCKQLEEQGNKHLRMYFARKMDHLYGIKADPNKYPWWIDN